MAEPATAPGPPLEPAAKQAAAASKTALGVAVLRAAHMALDGEPKILNDTVSALLLDGAARSMFAEHPERLQKRDSLAIRSSVVLRSRYAEDRLQEAVQARGVRQLVVLGAGLDTFAFRQPEWAAIGLRIFEVDHPASQEDKRTRLAAAGLALPPNLEFVPIDFETTSLRDGLRTSSLDASAPIFLSCLGVLVYLTEDAISALFDFAASLAAGSEIVFTFTTRPAEDWTASQRRHREALAATVAEVGEPFRTHFEQAELVARLAPRFAAVRVLEPDEAAARYYAGRVDGLSPPSRGFIASAVCGEPTSAGAPEPGIAPAGLGAAAPIDGSAARV